MKKIIGLTALSIVIFVVGAMNASAQDTRLSSAPQEFRAFFSTFLSAVHRNDKPLVANMSIFPFEYAFDTEQEGNMSKAQFIRRFAEIFTKRPKTFLSESDPGFARNEDGTYVISTEEASHLIFVKRGGTFKFKAYFIEP